MTIKVPNAAETDLSIKVAELLWHRRTRPMTVGDLLHLLYPNDPDRERQHKKVERGARLACNDMDWIVGKFPDGTMWFASPSVAKTMTPAPAPEPVVAKTKPEAPARDPDMGDDATENRIRRALRASDNDMTVDDLAVAAFPRMRAFKTTRDAVRALGDRAAAAMGWRVEEGPGGIVFTRRPEAQPTFTEIAS